MNICCLNDEMLATAANNSNNNNNLLLLLCAPSLDLFPGTSSKQKGGRDHAASQ